MKGLQFRVQGLGLRVKNSGFIVEGIRVLGFGLRN
jgi:hypothetical protein